MKRAEDYAQVGRTLSGAVLSAAVFEGVDTPWLTPAELGAMGFRHVSFPATLIFRAVGNMRDTLTALRRHADGSAPLVPMAGATEQRQAPDLATGLAGWRRIETAGIPPA